MNSKLTGIIIVVALIAVLSIFISKIHITQNLTIGDICQILCSPTVSTTYGIIWQTIIFLFSWYGVLVAILLCSWVAFELLTRNGKVHYNSENGFSPTFNRFIGSGTYVGLQIAFFFVTTTLFGAGIYCLFWPLPIHYLIFKSTGTVLNRIGFWPRLESSKKFKSKRYKKF